MTTYDNLLGADEPPPFRVRDGASPFVFGCDHAGRRIPRALGDLGVSAADLDTHIAWDIGVQGLGEHLAAALDGWLITQTYSRLVIDCNRSPEVESSIVKHSAGVDVPGNHSLTREQAEQRAREIFHPYHDEIRAELDRRAAQGAPTIYVALHSFTPSMLGRARPWHAGVLYRDRALAHPMLELLRAEGDLVVGDNEPYSVSALSDYSLLAHGEDRKLPHVELEIRQDLIADLDGQRRWAARLARLLPIACAPFLREAFARAPLRT